MRSVAMSPLLPVACLGRGVLHSKAPVSKLGLLCTATAQDNPASLSQCEQEQETETVPRTAGAYDNAALRCVCYQAASM
jgi:hypothetical protein